MLAAGTACMQLRLSNIKDCFLHLASQRASQLHLEECQAIELSWGLQQTAFLSWVGRRYAGFEEENVAEISRQLGMKLGLKDGEQVFLRPCAQVSSCQQVVVEPLSPSDWEILELHSTSLERYLMDQIRIVYPGGIFPIWIEKRTVIYLEVGSLMPAGAYGRLDPFTELVVSPKLQQIEGASLNTTFVGYSSLSKEPNLGSSKINENFEKPRIVHSSKKLYDQHEMNENHTRENQDSFSGSIMSNIWHLIKNKFSVNSHVAEQLPSKVVCKHTFLNTVSTSFEIDSIFRVCKRFPSNLEMHGSKLWNRRQPDTVHIFSWHHDVLPSNNSDTQIIYGKLTKLLSYREQKEISKQNLLSEKKKIDEHDTKARVNQAKDESCIIKIICHGCEHLKCTKPNDFHSGKVWIPDSLRKNLNVEASAVVRINSLKLNPSLPSRIQLQPLQMLPQEIKIDDVKSSFLSWLNVVSSEDFPFFAALSNFVQIPIAEREIEFMLVVEQLEAKSNTGGSICFFLYPDLIKDIYIEVVMHPTTTDTNAVQTVDDIDQILSFYKMSCLGGVHELAVPTLEHISLSLLGHPLSLQVASVAKGLQSGAVLLTGVKGSGKTTLAKAICREASDKLEAHVEVIDCKALRGKRVENIRKQWEDAFAEATWRQPSVVLMDDLDHIIGAASTPEHEHSAEAILSKQLSQTLKYLFALAVSQGSLIALIATSISEYTLHPSLICAEGSRIFQCINGISLPNQDQRVQILTSVIQNKTIIPLKTLKNIDLQKLAKATEGFVARDFVMLMERAVHSHLLTSKSNKEQELCLTTLDFHQALKGFTPTSLRNTNLHKPKDLGWDKVGGLQEVKQILMDTIQLSVKYPQLFAKLPIRQQSGILLYGAPGTGKTLLASVVARESGINFISIKGPELLSKYIGASEQAIRDVFSKAQAAKPCILFFDEFDSIAPRRGHDNTGVTDRVVNQLLTQLDGVEGLQGVYVLAATSRPDLIDPALLRPGRLDKSVYCPPPDQVARFEILKALSQSLSLADDVDLQQIATMTEYFTGADLKALLCNAQLDAVHSTISSTVFRDAGSGSDSDMSLSSMIFLNHSNGSDESTGDGERWLEQSPVYLDTSEILPDDPCPNIWRLYFGSSYESELGTGTSSEQNSQCLSGPNSMTLDHTITSVRDTISSHAPAFMTSLQEGYQELSQEQVELLRFELNVIKANTRIKKMEGPSHNQSGPVNSSQFICQSHLLTALTNTRPSISQQEWCNFVELYDGFQKCRGTKKQIGVIKAGQRVTLA
ncbi:peroxisome biogenesis factor 1 isoform X1 [Hemiscyllium ocellatum]|uniref:peroxisome biogenesis factor 1 isoform X1 n=2 Tax=Hemiscyllium ocellatum TaxID=170820 RepID=UPI002967787A|nr:peroxisome biogenesis factor 1 isoform X1 [Hemiscyllium ocellatum]